MLRKSDVVKTYETSGDGQFDNLDKATVKHNDVQEGEKIH